MENQSKKYVVQVPTTAEAIKDLSIDKSQIAWFRRGETWEPFIMYEVEDEALAKSLNNMYQREQAVERRERRCMVQSDKTGRAIRCETTNSCEHCPYQTTYLAYQPFVGSGNISYDQYEEDNDSEPASVMSEEERVIIKEGIEWLIDALSDIDPVLGDIARWRADEVEKGEIVQRLGYKKGDVAGYRLISKMEKMARELWNK